MPTLAKRLYAGAPGTTSTNFYTVPSTTTTIVKNITLTNTMASIAVVTITIAGKNIVSGYSVAPNDTVMMDLSLVLNATEIIAGLQTTANAVNVFISGVEVS